MYEVEIILYLLTKSSFFSISLLIASSVVFCSKICFDLKFHQILFPNKQDRYELILFYMCW